MSLDLWYGTRGPQNAKIVFVAESWGREEERQKLPLVGQSGKELDRMLMEAGINPAEVFFTNVVAARPLDNEMHYFFEDKEKGKPTWKGLHPTPMVVADVHRLYSQIDVINPKIVIAAGNYALWALTDNFSVSSLRRGTTASVLVPGGIMSWRGSMLTSTVANKSQKVLPIIHPAAILRQWYQRPVTVQDLRTRTLQALSDDWRPTHAPTVIAPPTYEQLISLLEKWLQELDWEHLYLSHDIETAMGTITSMSFATGGYNEKGWAITIPFVKPDRKGFTSYWTADEEFSIWKLLMKLLGHPNLRIIGQNYNYDTQYIDTWLNVRPVLHGDTMVAHHLLFLGTPKGLDYLSSLYCRYHVYWKDDLKEWSNDIDWNRNLLYNAEDALRTWECWESLHSLIVDQGMEELWSWELKKNALALRMCRRGVRINKDHRGKMAMDLLQEQGRLYAWLGSMIPQEWLKPYVKTSKKLWYQSNQQQQILFYELLGLAQQNNRKSGRPTLNFEALETLKKKHPELTRIFNGLIDLRSVNVFYNTFVTAEIEPNGRIKCSFNTTGTETLRWSSSANAFGRGTNLQNIPAGDEE